MIYGDGTGALATVASATGTAVVVDDTRNLIEGMVVDIFNADAAVITGARIVFVDRINKTVSMDKTVETATAGAKLYVQGSKDNEITGL